MLALLEDEARRLGVRRLFLEVEHGNRPSALYRRAGYVDHRRHLMSKRLDQSAVAHLFALTLSIQGALTAKCQRHKKHQSDGAKRPDQVSGRLCGDV